MPKFDRPPRDWPLRGDPARPVRPEPARQGNQMGTMAPIRPTVQRLHRISLTAGRPLGGLLEVLEVLEVVCRPGGVRLAAGVPGGGVADEGEAEDEQRSRCADSSPRLLERRPTAVPGGPFVELPGARPPPALLPPPGPACLTAMFVLTASLGPRLQPDPALSPNLARSKALADRPASLLAPPSLPA